MNALLFVLYKFLYLNKKNHGTVGSSWLVYHVLLYIRSVSTMNNHFLSSCFGYIPEDLPPSSRKRIAYIMLLTHAYIEEKKTRMRGRADSLREHAVY